MAELTIRVDGVPELRIKLKDIINELNDLQVMQDIAEEGARLARGFVPVRSGRLRGSIRPSKSKNKAVVRAGGRGIPYASVQNWGWPARNIPATQYMQRADDAIKPRLPSMIEAALQEVIRKRGL